MTKLSVALILDNSCITKWQRDALEEAQDIVDIRLILNCTNTRTKKRVIKHFFYYVLNIFTLRNHFTKRSVFKSGGVEVIPFECKYDGVWQAIPTEVSMQLKDNKVDAVIKFGMSLLRIDDYLENIPILSFHHGNPSSYRGRPAGFYELLHNEEKSGLIVQKLTNKIDSGEVLAFAESKLVHHSYKKSVNFFYGISRFLLKKSLENLQNNEVVDIEKNGRNYSLPSNFTVTQFVFLLTLRKIRNLFYGAFFEKKWKVGTTDFLPIFDQYITFRATKIDEIDVARGYTFYADPFFSLDGANMRVEALSATSGLGDIIEIDLRDREKFSVCLTGNHYSYPFPFLHERKEHLMPEVASHSSQYFFDLSESPAVKKSVMGLSGKRIVDATLFEYEDYFYLFFGENDLAANILNLYVAEDVNGEFKRHSQSPICITPTAARMGGRILLHKGKIFRFGQNNNRGYGASLTVLEIIKLSPVCYEEKVCGSLQIDDFKGPHTVDYHSDLKAVVLDYYEDGFSLFAGYRRLRSVLSKR